MAVDAKGKVMIDIKSRYDKSSPTSNGLDIGEWAEIIKACVKSYNNGDMDPKIAESFMEMAGDGNKFLLFDVFEHCICRKPMQSEQELRRVFKSLDKDGSGYADAAEIKVFFQKKNVKNFSDDILDKLLEKADTNKDGKIDVEEFINCWKGKGKN